MQKQRPEVTRRLAPVKTGYYGDRAYRATIVLGGSAHIRGFGRYKDVALANAEQQMVDYLDRYYPREG